MIDDKTELFVSLGHNSSAVVAVGGAAVAGYEQERLDRKKSSSAYPREAIEKALGANRWADEIFVSHWFDDFMLGSNKYLDMDHLKGLSQKITSLDPDMTHHDAHARSAAAFFRNRGVGGDSCVVVLDGFGSRQECFSVYHNYDAERRLKRIHRTYGYHMSLGLMYQYVTEYLGLKPNQDEYKLLGYESHVLKYVSIGDASRIAVSVITQAQQHAAEMLENTSNRFKYKGLIDYEALHDAKRYWVCLARSWQDLFSAVTDPNGIRACVAYCAQTFIEACVVELIGQLAKGYKRLILTGGCFYNVKLNRAVQKATGMEVLSHPLAGDQGAAMGLSNDPPYADPTALGVRSITPAFVTQPNAWIVAESGWVQLAADLITAGKIVNVVRDEMEYGPRALCNTSTLALPTTKNVSLINALNERDESMPMAPVMLRSSAKRFLDTDELRKISVSDRYMITTCAFNGRPPEEMMGVAHKDPIEHIWTARPQVVDMGPIADLLTHVPNGTLINTSFNYHGEPIVYSIDDAMRTHAMQQFRAQLLNLPKPITIVVAS